MRYIIIPDFILEHDKLNPTAKLLMGVINSLSYKDNICFASNEYLSKRIRTSKRTITATISMLKKYNLIRVEVVNHLRNIYPTFEEYQNYSIDIDEFH